eukprot:TRINITY_DN1451_c0_g1_i1.p1 TRINITY_DN1451_c0_g1~~TRINITY_DN1451_c0_g1_i1.p1  ORF type:complete len:656 (-),score=116.36 TRINITY_DN1451_c0_g1_i1:32-1999(-)
MSVQITIVKARNLRFEDKKGPDPFVILQIGDKHFRTKPKVKTAGPIFNESFAFEPDDAEQIVLRVCHNDKKSPRVLASLAISTSSLLLDSEAWYPLTPPGSGELSILFSLDLGEPAPQEPPVQSRTPQASTPSSSRPTSQINSQSNWSSATNTRPSGDARSNALGQNNATKQNDQSPKEQGGGAPAAGQYDKQSFKTGPKLSGSSKDEVRKRMRNVTTSPHLDLSSIQLTMMPYKAAYNNMYAATQIKVMDLGFNKLLNWPQLAPFVNIEVLTLTGNQMTVMDSAIGLLLHLRELMMNGNRIKVLPPQIGRCVKLEKIHIANNLLTTLPLEIGYLVKLEELLLNGNPLGTGTQPSTSALGDPEPGGGIPRTIGKCSNVQILDLSGCQLDSLPNELTRMPNLLELNLSCNDLKVLPATMGRMTRLAKLDLSDNQIKDLPISMGFIKSLEYMALERNPIGNPKLLERYSVSVGHAMIYLEARLEEFMADNPSFTAASLLGPPQTKEPSMKKLTKGATMMDNEPRKEMTVEEKISAVKKEAQGLLKEIMIKLSSVKRKLAQTKDMESAVPIGQVVRNIKLETDKIRNMIPPIERPNPPLIGAAEEMIIRMKKTVNVALLDLERTMGSVQNCLMVTKDMQLVITLAKTIQVISGLLTPY